MLRTDNETTFTRTLPAAMAAAPCLVIVLLMAQIQHVYGIGFTQFVANERAAVQIIVQILSHGFGLMQTYSLRTYYTFGRRVQAFRRPVSMEELGLWAAISSGCVDYAHSSVWTLLSTIILVASVIPGALWAGALTPVITPQSLSYGGTVEVPTFSTSSSDFWDSEFQVKGFSLWNRVGNCQGAGLMTTCPVPTLHGSLLSTLSSATTANNTFRSHAKIDSTEWSYLGRSYGVGSSLGLSRPSYAGGIVDAISYTEYGYVSRSECIFNRSSAYTLTYLGQYTDTPNWFTVESANGFLPNSFDDGIGEGGGEQYNVVSNLGFNYSHLAWSARAIGSRNFLSIATGLSSNYSRFNQAQCQIFFTPSAFNISANMTSNQITVAPRDSVSITSGLLPNLTVTTNVMNSINLVSRLASSSYSSTLGDALMGNLANFLAPGAELSTSPVKDEVILQSLENSLDAALDAILGAYGASQIALARDTAQVPLRTFGPATNTGDRAYIYTVLGFSSLVLLLHLVELIRTRAWSGLLVFNIFDVRCIAVALSVGGTGIAEALQSHAELEDRNHHTSRGQWTWRGNANDEDLAALRIRFLSPGVVHNIPALTVADEDDHVQLQPSMRMRNHEMRRNGSSQESSRVELILQHPK